MRKKYHFVSIERGKICSNLCRIIWTICVSHRRKFMTRLFEYIRSQSRLERRSDSNKVALLRIVKFVNFSALFYRACPNQLIWQTSHSSRTACVYYRFPTPKYRHGLNCGHGLRRITSIVRSPAKDIIWLDSLYRFWVAAPCIRRVRTCVRACVRAWCVRTCVRARVRACVLWVMAVRAYGWHSTYVLHALHVHQILRSCDESIGDIKLMASYLSIELQTADWINLTRVSGKLSPDDILQQYNENGFFFASQHLGVNW